eukprot:363519-Chlamydomonas_euryale.AAC.7
MTVGLGSFEAIPALTQQVVVPDCGDGEYYVLNRTACYRRACGGCEGSPHHGHATGGCLGRPGCGRAHAFFSLPVAPIDAAAAEMDVLPSVTEFGVMGRIRHTNQMKHLYHTTTRHAWLNTKVPTPHSCHATPDAPHRSRHRCQTPSTPLLDAPHRLPHPAKHPPHLCWTPFTALHSMPGAMLPTPLTQLP